MAVAAVGSLLFGAGSVVFASSRVAPSQSESSGAAGSSRFEPSRLASRVVAFTRFGASSSTSSAVNRSASLAELVAGGVIGAVAELVAAVLVADVPSTPPAPLAPADPEASPPLARGAGSGATRSDADAPPVAQIAPPNGSIKPLQPRKSEMGDDVFVGTWEGTFEGTRAPTFITLHLSLQDGAWSGMVEVLGNSVPLESTTRSGRGISARLGPGGPLIEVELSGEQLTGVLTEREHRFPLALERVPLYPPAANRAEAWSQDLDALGQRFLREDRSFTPAQKLRALEMIDELRPRLARLSDEEIIMRMATVVSLSDNAHTRLYLVRNRTELRRLPIRLWWFSDGLYVVRATPEHRRLLGCRVEDFAGVPSRLARDRVSPAFAGNPSWTDYKSVYFLTSPEALYGFGITKERDRVELGLSQCDQAPFRASVTPLPLEKSKNPTEAWWDLSPLHRDERRTWAHVLDSSALPLHLRNPELYYWYEYLPDSKLLYFHYSRSSNMAGEPTSAFAKRLLAAFDEHDVRAFVLDLRYNTGGNYGLAKDLMAELRERTKAMPRFVITGRATFSAGMTQAVLWREEGVTFVGEEIGDVLDYWSEGGNIILPNSGLAAHFANAMHSYSTDPCPADVPCFLDLSTPSLRPDLPVTSAWGDYVAKRDPAMESVMRALADAAGGGR